MKKMWNVSRVIIGAPHGHSGKTTISIGLVGALHQIGYQVQAFKKGPDYIDPSWLGLSSGRACRNLDCYWMDNEQIQTALIKGTTGADLAIIEGAMGLFDGVDLAGTGSTAQLARATQSPVILVVDTTRMTRSIAALVLGFLHFDPTITIAGVILNKIARPRHEAMLRAAIKEYCGIPVLGAIPKNAYSLFPERHLGLIPSAERTLLQQAIAGNIEIAKQYLDLEGIIAVAGTAQPLSVNESVLNPSIHSSIVKIGVILDQAFTFYYPENLEALEGAGAELVYIKSMEDEQLPNVDGLYIGGGFPEVFGTEISANIGLRQDIRQAADKGLPIYAECGGLMYLGRKIIWQNTEFTMCGVLPVDVIVEQKPQGHGYTLMESIADNPFFATGSSVKGHEFHHSKVVLTGEKLNFAYQVIRGQGINGCSDGVFYRNTFATYNHIHAVANPEWAKRFVIVAKKFRSSEKY